MIKVEIRHENSNGKEFGYGTYVNGYIIDDWFEVDGYSDGGQGIYASECVPRGANTEKRIKAAERRVRRTAMRRYKKECVG